MKNNLSQNAIAVPFCSGTTRQSGSKKESTTSSSVKDKDRELAKAINAEFSDDDEDKDAEENWEVDDKVIIKFTKVHFNFK